MIPNQNPHDFSGASFMHITKLGRSMCLYMYKTYAESTYILLSVLSSKLVISD